MALTLFTVEGCLRCKIVKQFLKTAGTGYQEYDALGGGREDFNAFYRRHRSEIHRGPLGVEFPIVWDQKVVRQGLPMVLAHVKSGSALSGFFRPGSLQGPWVDGIQISGGDPDHGAKLLELLAYLKGQALKIQVETNGLNVDLLKAVIAGGLADRVIMAVKGPLNLYASILQRAVDPEEITESINVVSQCKDYQFITEIAPIYRGKSSPGQLSYLTQTEIAETARLIKASAGDSRQPYRLSAFDPEAAEDERLRQCEPLAPDLLFRYRSMARKHQFKTEIAA